MLLARGLNEDQKDQVESWDVPGVILHPEFARRYNYGRTGAHALGHVSADGVGLAGVEQQYEQYLKGHDGRRAVKRDRLGRIKAFVGGPLVEPRHGESVVLTVDLIRQTILEEELARGMEEMGAAWGTAIALDPHNGEILALANYPTYDPNRAAAFGENARRNRAVTDRIEPGSTFKLIAAIAAIEQGKVRMDEVIDTGPGWLVQNGRTLRDSHALGEATFEEIIANSSNIGMSLVSERLSPGSLYQYARNLGFGQRTLVDLPGEIGGRLKKPEEWSRSTRSALSRGYEVDVSPLQMAAAYCALANGGLLVHPHIVAERRDVTGRTIWHAAPDSVRRAFKPETAAKLLPALERVVSEGTAKRAALDGLRVAGKTGTAQKVRNGRYEAGAYRASFIGFFPADDPSVVLLVILDEPRKSTYGGTAAAPIFQRTASRWIATFPKVAERVAPTDSLPTRPAVAPPRVDGWPLAVAAASLRAIGESVEAEGLDAAGPVTATLVAGSEQNRLVSLRRAPAGEVAMPDLAGLSARQALFWLQSRGVDVHLNGDGRVVEQSPAPGSPMPLLAELVCE